MHTISTSRRNVILQISLICAAIFTSSNTFSQSQIQPITVVQSADRAPLYPFHDHNDHQNFVYPSVIRKNGSLTIFASRQYDVLEMIDGNGVLVLQENIKGRTGRFDIPLKATSSGINYVRLRDRETMIIQKVMIIQ